MVGGEKNAHMSTLKFVFHLCVREKKAATKMTSANIFTLKFVQNC